MASGGPCGHGVMGMMLKRLGQCQAQSASRNTATKCQPMTKTLALPGADRKDGLLNATLLWPRFLGVDMLLPIVNTEKKMPAKMLEALGLHETRCVVTGVKSVTEESVKAFLTERYGEKFANTFDQQFLFSSQDS
jgi:hypothetical protein